MIEPTNRAVYHLDIFDTDTNTLIIISKLNDTNTVLLQLNANIFYC